MVNDSRPSKYWNSLSVSFFSLMPTLYKLLANSQGICRKFGCLPSLRIPLVNLLCTGRHDRLHFGSLSICSRPESFRHILSVIFGTASHLLLHFMATFPLTCKTILDYAPTTRKQCLINNSRCKEDVEPSFFRPSSESILCHCFSDMFFQSFHSGFQY